jgi:hypothetical protein
MKYRNGEFVSDICVEDLPNANLETMDQLVLPCKDYVKVRRIKREYKITRVFYRNHQTMYLL